MKKLTQEVFNRPDCPKWAKSAAVDSDGEAYVYTIEREKLKRNEAKGWWEYKHNNGAYCDYIGSGYDTTNWQNSAINRE